MSGKPHDPERKFWRLTDRRPDDECWPWRGRLNSGGYGRIAVNGLCIRVHRFAYELMVGPIPEGLVIDHLCRNRSCVNPLHLEPVSAIENTKRGWKPNKTHCVRGHEFTPENTSRRPNGTRRCLKCHAQDERARQARRRGDQRLLADIDQLDGAA